MNEAETAADFPRLASESTGRSLDEQFASHAQYYTAADIFAAAQGRHSLRREPVVTTAPLAKKPLLPAGEVDRGPLPVRRDTSQLTAADIMAIAKAPQPWLASVA